MSIDDKMERLHRERRLTERTNAENPSNKNSSYEGYTIAQEEYIPANATQSEPMDFCPECNGMMYHIWMDINARTVVSLKEFLKS